MLLQKNKMNRIVNSNFIKRIITGIILISLFIYFFSYKYFVLMAVAFGYLWMKCWKESILLTKKQSLFLYVYIWGSYIWLLYWMFYKNEPKILAYIFCLAVLHDIGGYIGGKLFGKHKITPRLSPSKTWEGFITSILFVIIFIYIFNWYNYLPFELINILKGIFYASLSFAGDIFISSLKRNAQVKESGDLFPGHGGALDRLDSVFPLIWFFWFF